MRPVPWSVVAIVGMLVTGLCIVIIVGKDTAAFLSVGMLVLTGLGFSIAQNNQTIQQTNGTQARMISAMERLAHRLGDMAPVPPDAVVEIKPDERVAPHP